MTRQMSLWYYCRQLGCRCGLRRIRGSRGAEDYIESRGCFASIRIREIIIGAFVKIRFVADCRTGRCCEHWNFRGMHPGVAICLNRVFGSRSRKRASAHNLKRHPPPLCARGTQCYRVPATQEGNMNGSDAPPASIGEEISESKVT